MEELKMKCVNARPDPISFHDPISFPFHFDPISFWGNDILMGGANNDTLWGGADSDYLDGGDGNDIALTNLSVLSGVETAAIRDNGTHRVRGDFWFWLEKSEAANDASYTDSFERSTA
jgi:hypothetical protein